MRQIRIPVIFFLLLIFGSCNHGEKGGQLPEPEEETFEEVEKVYHTGDIIDELNGVSIFYNGNNIVNTFGRNKSIDGYNFGLKWQCVEFIKRYYYQEKNHRMPNSWGHAKDFFNPLLRDGGFNRDRALYQYKNGSYKRPKVDDIIVFGGHDMNSFGHVGIISKVSLTAIEVVQQNVGIDSRIYLKLIHNKGRCFVRGENVLGWLGEKRYE